MKNILFLGTTTSRMNNIFATDAATIRYPSLELQEQVSNVINTVLKGDVSMQEPEVLVSVIKTMQLQSGCDGVVLGCTELSIVYDAFPQILHNLSITILDPLVIISHQLINEAINKV